MPRVTSRIDRPTFLVLVLLLVTGLLFLTVSMAVRAPNAREFTADLLRELGIVLFAVFSISLLYELWLADKYEETFLSRLRAEIQGGESNAAVCASLGIRRIFTTRDRFQQEYPFSQLAGTATSGTRFQVTGRSLFLLMSHSHDLKKALAAGAEFQLCLLDFCLPEADLRRSPDVEPKDIEAALAVFSTHVVEWLRKEKPPGRISVRCHCMHMLDSCLVITGTNNDMCLWELSFGRDLASKRLFMLEPAKGLGRDIVERYSGIWNGSRIILEYQSGELTKDEITNSRTSA